IAELSARNEDTLVPVLNLTGTVLHTNLGRAYLPEKALEAVTRIARGASNLEFQLDSGIRGDRDEHIASLLTELTGAESVTVVNNNAAAVLLCLNTLAEGREVCISRGELVEIGGSFRIPEVMAKSGCNLAEIGATNRTHRDDYVKAINEQTGLLLKVHTSNYEIRGFTNEVSYDDVAALSREYSVPFMADLGSGTLVNLEDYGLAHEPTVQEVLSAGADVVTFSGDKLLGGPQAGIIAGRKELIDRIKQNPLKRALRVDKMTMAALTEVLKLYLNPEKLIEELPTLAFLSRSREDIASTAEAMLPVFESALQGIANVAVIDSQSQIGSGALPLDQLPSCAIEITPIDGSDSALRKLVSAFRNLPTPMIGRMQDGRLLFDLRTVTNVDAVATQLKNLGGQ
ncbi:MAG: L-seryl-tRNA(Sec) selenium transferase, partial [Gammaproteobacteria bacterium]|nr:L-seryl-tRNA(Sec) selenium transferase [Gammaproteobacteria bacterium]